MPESKAEGDDSLSALAQLMEAHADVLAAMTALEALMESTPPAKADLAMTRWKLMQASRRRRRLLDEVVYPEAERAAGGTSCELVELRAVDARLMLASTRHIATWDIDHILDDWSGYLSEWKIVSRAMRNRIIREKAVLYPLLGGRYIGPDRY